MFKRIVLPVLAAILLTVSISGIAFAAEGDPQALVKTRGEVIAVDPAAGKFRIENPEGAVLTFFVSAETAFRGLDGLEELEVGWKAGVAAREDEDGKLQAVLVVAGEGLDLEKVRGQVTDLNAAAGKFSIQTPDGGELRFFVDENTRYGGQIASLEELEVGMGAGVAYQEGSEGKLIAVGLVAGYAPDLIKVKGEVTGVDYQLDKFEILTSEGERMRFFVDENTRFQGQLSSLAELQVGWQAGVAAKEGEDGTYTAVLLIAGIRPESIRVQGEIAGVDPGAGKFRLESADGEVLTFFEDEKTTYRGGVSGIADLAEGMRAGVAGYENGEGKLIARVVVAGDPEQDRPEIIRAQGSLKSVSPGAGKFQLETSDGRTLTVYVDGNTTYRGQATDFDDLEKGMRAGFVGYLDEDGKIVARVVVAGFPRTDDHRGGDRPAPDAGLPREERSATNGA